ncbi:alpha-ketoglutarate-dependent dioxygenase AlkB, partial [Pseudomonas aeruginosa]
MDLFADAPLTLPDADLRYLPHWLDAPLASAWLLRLEQETPWEQPILRIHGEEHPTPPLVAWYGDPDAAYRYSAQVNRPLPWTAFLGRLRARGEPRVGRRGNGGLLQYSADR